MPVVRFFGACVFVVSVRDRSLRPLAIAADSVRVSRRSELRTSRKFLVKVVTNLGSVDWWTSWSEDQRRLLGQSHRLVCCDQRALHRGFRDSASTVRVSAVLVADGCCACHLGYQSCGFNLVG